MDADDGQVAASPAGAGPVPEDVGPLGNTRLASGTRLAGGTRPRSGELPRGHGQRAGDAVPLAGAIGSYGMWSAFLATTTSLFLADALHVAPLAIGLFFTVRGVAAIVINLVAGRISDRLPDRRLMIAIAGAGGAGAGLCFAVLRDYPVVLVLGAVCYSVGGIAYSQLFAYTSEFAQAGGRAVTTFTSAMRSVFSASWVLGPPLGLFLLTRYGFGPLYLATAALSLATGVLGRRGLRRIPARPSPAARPATGRGPGLGLPARTWLLLGAVIVLSAVNQMYNIDVALYVTRDLHIGAQFVGWMAGLSAVLEVPMTIVAGRLADRVGKLRVTLAAAGGATVFFCLLPLAATAPTLLALQPLNAAWTAVALSIPMVMVQQEAPGGAGAASALYGSAFMAAVMLAGAITGVAATAVGYGNVFWACAALSAGAGGLLLARTARPTLRSWLSGTNYRGVLQQVTVLMCRLP